MMWRNSVKLSFSSRIFFLSSSNPNFVSSSSSIFIVNGLVRPLLSQSYYPYSSSSSPSIPSSESTAKLGSVSNKSDGILAYALRQLRPLTCHRKRGMRWTWLVTTLVAIGSSPKLASVVATSGTGYILGSGSAVDFAGLCWTCAGTMMVAASSNSLNQVFEINNDARMKRTRQRPLPSKRITIPHAVTWASSVGLAGTALLAWKANMLTAGLAASNLILYAFVYTPLKQIHPVNTWVGAVVGAIPPLLGWAAASGQVSLHGMVLPAALYFWQIPHFMALAYLYRNDYATGGFRMFSLADASGQRTAAVALRNCLYLVPLGFIAYDWGITSGWFSLESTLLTLAISAAAFSFYRDQTTEKARRMFHASLLYLPVFMSGLQFHRLSDDQQCLPQVSSQRIIELCSSSETAAQESGNVNRKNKMRLSAVGAQARPAVA